MFSLIYLFICLVPGSESLTFDGKNSRASLQLGNITAGYLSLDLQTRQADSFVLASYDESTKPHNLSSYFVVAINDDGKLTVRGNYSGNVISITGTAVITDGVRHQITVESSNNGGNTTVSIDGNSKSYPGNILNDEWSKLVSNKKLELGKETVTSMSPNEYFGALTIKRVGNQVPQSNDYSLSSVVPAWISSNPCKSDTCFKGKCVDIFNAFRCDCNAFYTGTLCNETINVSCDFDTSLCNQGTCMNLTEANAVTKRFSNHGKDYFKCNCSAGYLGNTCLQETDECVPNNCKNRATCVDGHLMYACLCNAGWTGQNCDADFDDCASTPCRGNGNCTDKFNDYDCQCFGGRYEGKNCTVDVNECSRLTNPCNGNGMCTNLIGDYSCSCNTGYYGKSCQHNSTEYCLKASPCRNGASCTPNGTGYHCTCAKGYTGKHCDQDYQECAQLKPCQNNATCNDSHNSKTFFTGYTCSCTAPYEGVNCTDGKNPCAINPCLNGGSCRIVSYDQYTCTCTDQFSGLNCLAAKQSSDSDDTIVIIIAVVVVIVVIIIAILLLLCYFKRNSGQQGTYKPNVEESQVGAVALDPIKKPKVERLI